MANLAESAALTVRHREPVVETALRLTHELLRLRPEGTSSDQWLASIFGLARAVVKVVIVAGGSAGATANSAPAAGRPFLPLARRRVKVKRGSGVGRAKRSGSRRKEAST